MNRPRQPKWSIDSIPDLSGRSAVVTGANTGLGYVTARVLAARGARVILACRSLDRGEAAAQSIRSGQVSGTAEVLALDLANLKSVSHFADAVAGAVDQLDLLVNNAGVMSSGYQRTSDGFEMQFGTNHVGHFALTGLLLPLLERASQPRVVTVSSLGHKMGRMDFDNLQFYGGRGYRNFAAYGRSKLANLLFAFELQRRLEKAGNSTISLAAHPGASQTDLGRHLEGQWFFRVFERALRWVVQDAEQGALPQLRAATDPDAAGGDYFGPGGPAELSGAPVRVRPVRHALNRHDAGQLWDTSCRLTGVRYLD